MNIERTKFVRRQTLSLAPHTVVGGDHDSPDVQILQINAMFSKGPAEEFIDKAVCVKDITRRRTETPLSKTIVVSASQAQRCARIINEKNR